ncbi:MAG TPA: hypothetical protein VMI31_19205 [Fimbriimonadaceae bacterium]|nr:hypothetical protein [Fimbriimonadaceae bacterium]
MAANSHSGRTSFLVLVILAVLVGIGIPVYFTWFTKPAPPKPTTESAPRTPPPPIKIDFVQPGTVSGTQASFSKDGASATADLQPDDAAVFWLKAEVPQRQAGAGGGGGGGRGGRGRAFIPLSIKDSAGNDYSFALERKDGGLFALHLKRGYDKKPDSLTVTESSGGKEIGSWKIADIPAPKLLLPDDALKGNPIGIVQLASGRGGRISASPKLNAPLGQNQGAILHPLEASYTPIDTSRLPNGLVSKPGDTAFDDSFNLPNGKMARRVSFDMQTYEGVTTTETVALKTVQIQSAFGQPYISVAKDETVATPSGVKLIAHAQANAPRRAPRKPHNDVTLMLNLDVDALKPVAGIAPSVSVQLVSPAPATLGLRQIKLETSFLNPSDGADVFAPPAAQTLAGAAPDAAVKTGAVAPLVFKITIIRPKLVSTKRIVLPVDPKVMEGGPGGGGNRASARPSAV